MKLIACSTVVFTYHRQDGNGFLQFVAQLLQGKPVGFGILGHFQLDQVVGGIEHIVRSGLAIALGRQSPAHDHDKHQPHQCHRDSHGRETEHPKIVASDIASVGGNNDIGWRANQRGQTTQQRAKCQRHQQQ